MTRSARLAVVFALVAQLAGCGASIQGTGATDAAVDGTSSDVAQDLSADVMCTVDCSAPPPGCHFEGARTCSPPTCGTLVCADAGAPVSCSGTPTIFPTFDRACSTAADCFVALHQSDCCGSRQALGIAASRRAAFDAAEATCEGMYPACGCRARATVVDDGSTAPTDADIVVTCDSARCTTHVRRVPTQHRASDAACAAPPAAGTCSVVGGPPLGCHADRDCTMGSNGRCAESRGGALSCYCTYDTCAHDSECHTGGPCACHGEPTLGGLGNTCVAGNCRTDSDCGASGFCSPSVALMGCGGLGGYYCHTPQDLCVNDADCGASSGPPTCAYSPDHARWECTTVLLCP